jgi:hypothetical protein
MNPIKLGQRIRRIDDYRIYKAIPGHTAEKAWRVLTNYKESSDFLTKAIQYSPLGASLLASMVPVARNGALSGFHKGHSTHAQRVWTMTWLGFGSLGSFLNLNWRTARFATGGVWGIENFLNFVIFGYAAPAIGGFVVVGQMLRSYGTCITVS